MFSVVAALSSASLGCGGPTSATAVDDGPNAQQVAGPGAVSNNGAGATASAGGAAVSVAPEQPIGLAECNVAKLDVLRCSAPAEIACTQLMNGGATLTRLATDFEGRPLLWWAREGTDTSECREIVVIPTSEDDQLGQQIGQPRVLPCGIELIVTQTGGHERLLAYAPAGVEPVSENCAALSSAPAPTPQDLESTFPIVDECGDMIWIGRTGSGQVSVDGSDTRELWILQFQDGAWRAPSNLGSVTGFDVSQALSRPVIAVTYGAQLQTQRVLLATRDPDASLSLMVYNRARGWSTRRRVASSVMGSSVALWIEGRAGVQRSNGYLTGISESGVAYLVWLEPLLDDAARLHAGLIDDDGGLLAERVLFEETDAATFNRLSPYARAHVLRQRDGRELLYWAQSDSDGEVTAQTSELSADGWGQPQPADLWGSEEPWRESIGEVGRHAVGGPRDGPASLIRFGSDGLPEDLGAISTPGDIDYPYYTYLPAGRSFLTWNQYDGESSVVDTSHCSEEALQVPEGCIPNEIAQPYAIEAVWVASDGQFTQRTACDLR